MRKIRWVVARGIEIAEKDTILTFFLFLLVILAIVYPDKMASYISIIDWRPIVALAGLILIATGLKESGYFDILSRRVLGWCKTERGLSIILVLLAVFLSTFLTNDVTLFVVVPITLGIRKMVEIDALKLVVFEAMAVNAGSALTPIGNPQNIFLWHEWGVSFITFLLQTLPLFIVLLVLLLLFTYLSFPAIELDFSKNIEDPKKDTTLFVLSTVMLAAYLAFLELRQSQMLLPLVVLLYALLYRRVLINTDWLLILLFIVVLIDFRVLSSVPPLIELVGTLDIKSSGNIFIFSAVTSQLISNVPAAIFVSNFSHNWPAIVYGVNIGGNGLITASFANIIALRMVQSEKRWRRFHKYSVPYFLITGWVAYMLFFN
ncbi:SLC13 family permease [Archaeoglobus neptunius]|uniref:SLC13 family permease n=1 Tax=Archaeoglobus neptunius TaxID=2798580 RepID=UPI001927424B|nr:SLC13 family permease [Archaeoglobus neptunius]